MARRMNLFGGGLPLPLVALAIALATPAQAKTAAEIEYARLVMRAKAGDRTVNYGRMRWLHTQTPAYRPYSPRQINSMRAERFALSGKCADALPMARRVLAEEFVSIRAHFAAAICYRMRGDAAREAFHGRTFAMLLGSIVRGTDGRSPARAFRVISVAEQRPVLRYLRLPARRIGRQGIGGKQYDVYQVAGQAGTRLYFDITVPFNALGRQLQKSKPPR